MSNYNDDLLRRWEEHCRNGRERERHRPSRDESSSRRRDYDEPIYGQSRPRTRDRDGPSYDDYKYRGTERTGGSFSGASSQRDRPSYGESNSQHGWDRPDGESRPRATEAEVQEGQKDYYKTLGVPKDASADDIKKAYRKRALLNHPDKNLTDPSAAQRFQDIGEAYATLGDEQKRSQYDSRGDGKMPASNTQRRSRYDHMGPSHDNKGSWYDSNDSFERFENEGIKIARMPFYPACEVCNQKSCASFHRWYTPAGYVWDYNGQVPTVELARKIIADFGLESADLRACSVCRRNNCTHPHRNYTREGAIAFFFAILERDEGFGNVERATVEAEKHFGSPTMRTSSTREGSCTSSPKRPRSQRSSHDFDEYDDDRDDYSSCRDGGGYRGRGTSYVYGENSDQGGFRGRGTTYIQGDDSTQGGGYRGRGTTYTYGTSSSSYVYPEGSFQESSRDNFGPNSTNSFSSFSSSVFTMSSRRRRCDDSDRYGSAPPRDPGYYNDREERSRRRSERDRW